MVDFATAASQGFTVVTFKPFLPFFSENGKNITYLFNTIKKK
jgi:hypothetical protein